MLNLGQILRAAREDKDLRQIDVMRLTGINNKNLSGYENSVAEPDLETLGTLFKLYGLSADNILGISPEKPEYTPDEQKLIRLYRTLPKDMQKHLLTQIQALADYPRRK